MHIDIHAPLTEHDALKEAQKCGGCKEECSSGCAVNVKIPSFVRAIKAGQFEKAADLMYEDNPFPCITGRLCMAKCQIACPKGVKIKSLERFIGDNFLPQMKKAVKSKKSVAIVGAGVTGLVSASALIENGVDVTLIEITGQPGGFLQSSVPDFRLPSAVLNAELERVLPQVKILYDSMVGTLYPLDELAKKHDAVIVATGASKPVFGVEGEHLHNVFSPKEYIGHKANGLSQAIVIGGTNGAIESAILARRRGAQATILLEQPLDEMDIDCELMKSALDHKVGFLMLTKPLWLNGERHVTSVQCQQLRMSDEYEGQHEVVPIEDSEFEAECDHVVIAKGYEAHPSILIHSNLRSAGKSKLWTNSMGQTTIPNVFAAGGIVLGFRPIEEVIAHAKLIAGNVVEFLKAGK